MRFKYLKLKKSHVLNTKNKVSITGYPGRRKFMKSMGLSALTLNPIFDSLKSISTTHLQLKLKNKQLKIIRNNRLAGEVSEKYFNRGYTIQLKETAQDYTVECKRLVLKNTKLQFSIKTIIKKSSGSCYFQIPEFNFNWSGIVGAFEEYLS